MSSENLYKEDDSLPVGVDRHVGQPITNGGPLQMVDQTNSELLQNGQLSFLEQKAQLQNEVAPTQPAHEDALMVITTTSQPSSDKSQEIESDNVDHPCITQEESQPDTASTDSELVPNPGYGEDSGHDKFRPVSKDWVMNKIDERDKSHRLEINELKEKVSTMQANFEGLNAQLQEKTDQLKTKQKELDDCHTKMKSYQSQVQELEEKLQKQSDKTEVSEQQKKTLQQQLKVTDDRRKELEQEVEHLKEKLENAEKAKKDNNHELFEQILKGQMDIRKEIKSGHVQGTQHPVTKGNGQQVPPEVKSPPDPFSPIQAGLFHFLSDRSPTSQEDGVRFTNCPSLSSSMTSSMCTQWSQEDQGSSHGPDDDDDDEKSELSNEPHDSDVD